MINSDLNSINILFGGANASFSFQKIYATGSWPNAMVVADFNKDGKLDVAVTNRDSNDLTILLNGCQ